ncbi:hypothetical protein P152DRAFT_106047 [Eremomyces bilateralis CBS 781.70]|uniref:Uncharacterized protein n=1 Tax=Eremomyces bilateralis CBS 781.70 TaxID=1392243 RepID=A0A6G1FX64_9PEZI|nr:uncharacterized protein P152DRAFT_106047 [Eremomyces bilateralis CBS 781.70]KAF1810256.1 hypothetical protein P152DRAFT_106047 [Eremomyces bilateralis CBS 781.70]
MNLYLRKYHQLPRTQCPNHLSNFFDPIGSRLVPSCHHRGDRASAICCPFKASFVLGPSLSLLSIPPSLSLQRSVAAFAQAHHIHGIVVGASILLLASRRAIHCPKPSCAGVQGIKWRVTARISIEVRPRRTFRAVNPKSPTTTHTYPELSARSGMVPFHLLGVGCEDIFPGARNRDVNEGVGRWDAKRQERKAPTPRPLNSAAMGFTLSDALQRSHVSADID